MDIPTPIAVELVKRMLGYAESFAKNTGLEVETLQERIAGHISSIESWSSIIQDFEMAKPKYTDQHTLSVGILENRRQLTSSSSARKSLDEDDLVSSISNFMLLGDPGSGKTTTMKRIVRSAIFEEPKNDNDTFQFPVLVRLRDIDLHRNDVLVAISDAVGISYVDKNEKSSNEEADGFSLKGEEKPDFRVGKHRLEQCVITFLNSTRALLLLDGLDEVNPLLREQVERQIERLSEGAVTFKLICTCRSGDYLNTIKGLEVCELQPLTQEEIDEIISMWASEPSVFKAAIKRAAYGDMLDRPLFLTQVITLFNNIGRLPERSSDVTKRLVDLAIFHWDQDRRIVRKSSYASFSSEEKFDFLCHLAFDLLFEQKVKAFSHHDLDQSYLRVCSAFGLPEGDSEQVAQEIESHTGIILKASYDRFEFSHLSVQEFLAASYIVREPVLGKVARYLKEHQAAVAVALSLSTNASDWLAAISLRTVGYEGILSSGIENVSAFVKRVLVERPRFVESVILGGSVLALISLDSVTKTDARKFIRLNGVSKSIRRFISDGSFIYEDDFEANRNGKLMPFNWLGGIPSNLPFEFKKPLMVATWIIEEVVEKDSKILRLVDRDTEVERFVDFDRPRVR